MKIIIDIKELSSGIADTIRTEASSVEEEKLKMRPEGLANEGEISRAILGADALIREALDSFLAPLDYVEESVEFVSELPTALVYNLSGGERRLNGRGDMYIPYIYNALKESALAEIFTPLNEEVGTRHNGIASGLLATMKATLLTKRKPTPRFYER